MIRRAIVVAVLIAFAPPAKAAEPRLPPGYTCQDVRDKVAQYGRFTAKIWAFANGFTRDQIREAEKCLR